MNLKKYFFVICITSMKILLDSFLCSSSVLPFCLLYVWWGVIVNDANVNVGHQVMLLHTPSSFSSMELYLWKEMTSPKDTQHKNYSQQFWNH